MLKITENKDELMVRHYPVMSLIAAGLLLIMGGLLAEASFDYLYASITAFDFNFAVVVTLLLNGVMLGFALFQILTAPIITTIFNRRAKLLIIESKSLLRKELRDFGFDEIENHLALKTNTHKSSIYYTPQVTVAVTGELIDLVSSGLSKRDKAYDIVALAHRYLAAESDKNSFRLTIFNDD